MTKYVFFFSKGSKVVISPFLTDRASSLRKTQIHVENVIARMKDFRSCISLNTERQNDEIFDIVTAITNLALPLIPLYYGDQLHYHLEVNSWG